MSAATDINGIMGQNSVSQSHSAEDIYAQAKGDDEVVTKSEMKDYLTEDMGLSDEDAEKIIDDVFGDNDQLNMTYFADKNEDLNTGILTAS